MELRKQEIRAVKKGTNSNKNEEEKERRKTNAV
jgi:hypothetical protein